MNNRKSKSKKRKLMDAEKTCGRKSNNIKEDLSSNSDILSCYETQDEFTSNGDSSSESDTSKKMKLIKRSKTSKAILSSDMSSESGDESCEKCAICLRRIVHQEVGNPEVCDHLFCSVCIIEWSKNSNVCPLDRQQFSIILIRDNKNGNLVKKMPVEEAVEPCMESAELEPLDDLVCEICGSGDREDILLLCDNCGRGFHTVCLTPPLEDLPNENEWFCQGCEFGISSRDETDPGSELNILGNVSSSLRSLRPHMVRTRLMQRVREIVSRIGRDEVLRHSDLSESEFTSEESDETTLYSDSDYEISTDQPSTSGLQKAKPKLNSKSRSKNKLSKSRTKKISRRKRRTSGKKKEAIVRKKGTATTNRKPKKRKTRLKTTRTKKIKVENADGTITEKIIKTRTYKKRRQKKKKKKIKSVKSVGRRLRVKSVTTPKTVKGRLALVLGMVPPKKPGQLLPSIKIKPNSNINTMDLNRTRAGIPKLHIFGPTNELQYYSEESDHDDFVISGSGGVATVTQQRAHTSRLRDRKKAALIFQSTPPSVTQPKTTVDTSKNEDVDILESILHSQAIWHSKDTNTNVKINADGSIEIIKKNKNLTPESSTTIDVQKGLSNDVTTQAPMYPGSGSRSGGFRPYNRNSNYNESRNSNQDNSFSSRGSQGQSGMTFSRFGGPAHNDREGYANYMNVPQGSTPFCRGGPPLRFRMRPRQQLRRIPFPPRSRPIWHTDEYEEETSTEKGEKSGESQDGKKAQNKTQEEEDIDLYSDIETNVDKTEDSGTEDNSSNYPILGPPPEPSAFLLGLDENGEFGVSENKDKSEVYDPAEPCDSGDEMVIDENLERPLTPEKQEIEAGTVSSDASVPLSTTEKSGSADVASPQRGGSSDDDEDCPIFSIYSSATREFSQKEEEERQREIAEDKRKLQEMKSLEGHKCNFKLSSNAKTEKTDLSAHDDSSNNDEVKIPTQINNDFSNPQTNQKNKEKEKVESRSSFNNKLKVDEKNLFSDDSNFSPCKSEKHVKERLERSSQMPEPDVIQKSESIKSLSLSPAISEQSEKYKRVEKLRKKYDSDSEEENTKAQSDQMSDKENEDVETTEPNREDRPMEKDVESDNDTVLRKVAVGLEGLDVEEVSSDNEEGYSFADKRSFSSLSLSDLSHRSKKSKSPIHLKKKKKNRKRKLGKSKSCKNYEEGEIDDSEKDNKLNESNAFKNDGVGNENGSKGGDKRKFRKSSSTESERQVLSSKENKKFNKGKSKDKDLSWKKPSKKEKNYREGKKRSRDRGKSKSSERKKSKSPTPKKEKKKSKERRKKTDKKKDIERYDVRKIVKNKEIRRTDAFGRDIISKSRSISRSRSRSPVRERSRNMLRRDSRSFSRSRSRSYRRGRSPIRRRYLRSRTRTRSKSVRISYSRSRSRSRSRKTKKKMKLKDRIKTRSRSRGRKSRSLSRNKRRSLTRSRSHSPVSRAPRTKKVKRNRRSWSRRGSRSLSVSPGRSRSTTRSPVRTKRSYTRSISTSWSRGRSPLPRTSSLEKLTVVLTTKDKKKWKKKKEGKKVKKDEKKKKKTGNSKEVFASGDNVLVSVNFRNNNNGMGNNGVSIINTEGRSAHLNSSSPVLGAETSRKKKRVSEFETDRVTKKAKKSNLISKKVVDVALSNSCPKRAKKLTRLNEKDAEVILNRKPVAVIDLDMSPYREQTPSPINVVVVSDSGSGDEGKDHSPQRSVVAGVTPAREVEKTQETGGNQSVAASAPSSPIDNEYAQPSGPKTPPEPQIKFSINKPQQLRQIANPLGDDDEDEDEIREDERLQRVDALDRRIDKELDSRNETTHKGPNTPPVPRGPSTPKTPPSPQTSPDAYDPFEPTKSRSPSPDQADKENCPTPKLDAMDKQTSVQSENLVPSISNADSVDKVNEVTENHDNKLENTEKSEAIPVVHCSSNIAIPTQAPCASATDTASSDSPERKIAVVITTSQNKTPTPTIQKAYTPVLKLLPMAASVGCNPPASSTLTVPSDVFSFPSPTKTTRANVTATSTAQVTGIQRLQHRLGSPVSRAPNSVKSTPEKRSTPRPDSNELFTTGNYTVRNVNKRNGEPGKQPRPLQDATNETIDMTVDMDDSPYSPASSEGDDLFDPPVEPSKPSQSKPAPSYKLTPKSRKSPVKQLSKFDLLFGPSLSPVKSVNKKTNAKTCAKPTTPKTLPAKPAKKGTTKKNLLHKMDEDQLRILDELPSSAVELQVKDKFLKKLNRQERVVDEVKTVLKPHYARKHITKEEYKDILRRSVPKICHSRSGEINPSKIQSLIEAYVRKFRHAKKKSQNATIKPKLK